MLKLTLVCGCPLVILIPIYDGLWAREHKLFFNLVCIIKKTATNFEMFPDSFL